MAKKIDKQNHIYPNKLAKILVAWFGSTVSLFKFFVRALVTSAGIVAITFAETTMYLLLSVRIY